MVLWHCGYELYASKGIYYNGPKQEKGHSIPNHQPSVQAGEHNSQ